MEKVSQRVHILLIKKKKTIPGKAPCIPIEGGVIQETVYRDVLLQEAVSQDGHRGEADVVHRQIGCIIQGLGGGAGVEPR